MEGVTENEVRLFNPSIIIYFGLRGHSKLSGQEEGISRKSTLGHVTKGRYHSSYISIVLYRVTLVQDPVLASVKDYTNIRAMVGIM